MITGSSGKRSRSRSSTAIPSIAPGIMRSSSTRSGSKSSARARPPAPSAASRTSNPSEVSSALTIRRMFGSSSMIRTDGITRRKPEAGSRKSEDRTSTLRASSMLHRRKLRELTAVGQYPRDESLAFGNPLDFDRDALYRALDAFEALGDVGRNRGRRHAPTFYAPRPGTHERKEHSAQHAKDDRN